MLTRIIKFKSHDWKHIFVLLKNMNRQLFKGDLFEAHEAWMWIKIHFSHDSRKQ